MDFSDGGRCFFGELGFITPACFYRGAVKARVVRGSSHRELFWPKQVVYIPII